MANVIQRCITALALHYFYVVKPDQEIKTSLKTAAFPKDTNDAQDEDYTAIKVAISKSKTDAQFDACLTAIETFKKKYSRSVMGDKDVDLLLNYYVEKKSGKPYVFTI